MEFKYLASIIHQDVLSQRGIEKIFEERIKPNNNDEFGSIEQLNSSQNQKTNLQSNLALKQSCFNIFICAALELSTIIKKSKYVK